jgi:hypothetical protein
MKVFEAIANWYTRLAQERAVRRGVALLDTLDTHWPARVDAANLNMSSPSRCVLGQLFGGYNLGVSVLGISSDSDNWARPKEYGFAAWRSTGRQVYWDYDHLTTLWRKVIENRQQQEVA